MVGGIVCEASEVSVQDCFRVQLSLLLNLSTLLVFVCWKQNIYLMVHYVALRQ